MDLNIIYEDDALLVCYKPAGIATETRRIGQQDMVSLLKNYRAGKGEQPYIGTIHRLDQPVEGLLVFAKTADAAAKLSKQVQERSIGKYYYAAGRSVKEGKPAAGCYEMESGSEVCLTDYILTDKRTNLSKVVPEKTPQAKKAVLDCRLLARQNDIVCFAVTLHSGRHHQIRVQLAHHGWPLVGDFKYGVSRGQDGNSGTDGQSGDGVQLALCAYRITFIHPVTGKTMDFSIKPKNSVFAGFISSF